MTENTASQVLPDIVRPTPAPEIPGGWEAGPPDFVGVGTMRSGTSWWWYLLMQHPRFAKVNVRHKEIHFFDHYLQGKPAPAWLKEGVPHLQLEDHLKERAKE